MLQCYSQWCGCWLYIFISVLFRVRYLLVLSPLGLQGFASLLQQLLLLTQRLCSPLQLLLFVPELSFKSLEFLLTVHWLGVQSLERQQKHNVLKCKQFRKAKAPFELQEPFLGTRNLFRNLAVLPDCQELLRYATKLLNFYHCMFYIHYMG